MEGVILREFIRKTISGKSNIDGTVFSTERTRNTNGGSSIRIAMVTVDQEEQSISFSTSHSGDRYEQHALEFARMLEEIANDPCSLPE